jgi:colanic acid biosynthesis glycosyl transferase WcaI
MRILVHDFGGYPYPIQLSRSLARRGHEVLHAYCGSLTTTPGGNFSYRDDDPPAFRISRIDLSRPLNKFSFVTRWRQENAYGRLAAQELTRFHPDVVISANTPLDAQRTLLHTSRQLGIPFIFWVQDLLGVAADRILRKKLPGVGALAGTYYLRLEQSLLQQSSAVVLITDDFRPIMQVWSVPEERLFTVENWAPLDALPAKPKGNAWAEAHGLTDKTVFMYSGTLAMKHDPSLLLQLALHFRSHPHVRIVVVSQGPGAAWLQARKQELALDNAIIVGFEPFDRISDVHGAADVLVAVLEPVAGVFSVPSKVLAYLCAARPLLLAMPPENLTSRIVRENAAGYVVPPTDVDAFLTSADTLLADSGLRAAMAANARTHAERTFDIERITDAFEHIILANRVAHAAA